MLTAPKTSVEAVLYANDITDDRRAPASATIASMRRPHQRRRPMSEYQCYEFIALDRPLTAKEMAELRAISTTGEITPTRFWNE